MKTLRCRPGDLAVIVDPESRWCGCLVEVHPFQWHMPGNTQVRIRIQRDWLVKAIGFQFPAGNNPNVRLPYASCDDWKLKPLKGDPDAAETPRTSEVPA